MNKKHFILGTLLATFFLGFAHARTQKSIQDQDETTPSSTTSTHAFKSIKLGPLQNQSKSANSVVEDWNSVCKQLCGAGLGGPACGPQCTMIQQFQKENHTQRVQSLLKDKGNSICQDLCNFNLGGAACKCQQNINSSVPIVGVNQNMICKTFCENNEYTLTGCSICQRIEKTPKNTTATISATTTEPTSTTTRTTASKPPSTTTITTASNPPSTTMTKQPSTITTTTKQPSTTTTTTNQPSTTTTTTNQPSTTTTTTNQPSTTTTTTNQPSTTITTTNQPSTTTTTTNQPSKPNTTTTTLSPTTSTTTRTTTTQTPKPPTTTPNWEQVCEALCKTGDGGALCNCDLPPFL